MFFLLVNLRNLRMISRQAEETLAKLNYAAAWPSVVRNGSAFPFQVAFGVLGYASLGASLTNSGWKTAYGSKGVAQVVVHA
jgi:hypothetical protein